MTIEMFPDLFVRPSDDQTRYFLPLFSVFCQSEKELLLFVFTPFAGFVKNVILGGNKH